MAQGKELLGYTATDKITGFSGVITGYVQYISGCSQYLLVPKMDKDGKLPEGLWFDEQRIDIEITLDPIRLNNQKTPGPDKKPSRNY